MTELILVILILLISNIVTFFITRYLFQTKAFQFENDVWNDITKAKSILNDATYKMNMRIKNE